MLHLFGTQNPYILDDAMRVQVPGSRVLTIDMREVYCANFSLQDFLINPPRDTTL